MSFPSTLIKQEHRNRLTQIQQLEVCQRVAHYWTNLEIENWFKETYSKDLGANVINVTYRYGARWRPVVRKFRDEYNADLLSVPIASKRKRLERLEEAWQKSKDSGHLETELHSLNNAREETEPKNQGSVTLQQFNQFNQLTDEELEEKKAQCLNRIETLRKQKEVLGAAYQQGE